MRRWALRICVFVILGAIVNVAVAWVCALWSKHPFGRSMMRSHPGELAWIVSSAEGFGITWVSLVPHTENWRLVDEGTVHIPRWSRAVEPPTQAEFDDPTNPYVMEFGYGWPTRSAMAWAQWNVSDAQGRQNPPRFKAMSGFEVLDDGSAEPLPFRMLPTRPLWPGFAINTMFYAFILWLLFAGPFALRRRRRIRRGLCPKCAYDLRGTPRATACPECGAAVGPNAAVTYDAA